ncbi:hypothetical protein HG535_0G05500 [Zygotorulaspora mrakii]|uniref:Alpha-factor-transporting ATPase n=1 Tax=Zygotorulaspora mrakii TaxID=42260 RepID=A0A7H9B7T6_ZYGMR|nr:uncharacterized protein HG535_0G05500 [Zygotorulaspora mrakii]QLG74667.1 hypothetical protein HG535_0G05500 [Zygotorulaspora mrakii]
MLSSEGVGKMSYSRIHLYTFVNVSKNMLVVTAALVSTIAAGLILPVTTILTGRVFDLLAEADNYKDKGVLHHELVIRSMSIMTLGGASLPITWTSISSWMSIGENQGFSVRRRLLELYMTTPLAWFDMNGDFSGKFTQLNRCVEELRSGSAETSAVASRGVITMLALIGTSFYYSWSLTLITMCTAPVIIAVAFFFSRLVEKSVKMENEQTSQASKLMNWSMNATKLVKLSCAQLKEVAKFREHIRESRKSFLYICAYTAANTAILRFLALTMFVQAFWFGSTMVRKGKLKIGDVVTCFHSCILLGATISGILHQLLVLQKGNVAVKQISDALGNCNNSFTQKQGVQYDLDATQAKIAFNQISFTYPNRPKNLVLNNLSLVFTGGNTTFIVGKSGSGKSTLSNLLLGFYENYEGDISINGCDTKSLNPNWLVDNILLVEQKCNIFNDTIRNNILLGSRNNNENEKNEQLKAACRISLLEKFILDIPNGLETLIGNGGVNLSGGQQQKLAIARAFMRDPPILILDEALSALDGMHRILIMKAIRRWRKGKTTIVLTHDLNQIEAEDYVYLFESGECIEKGYQNSLTNDIKSNFYHWKHFSPLTDELDNISQLTTVDEEHIKDIALESYVDMDVETPKLEHDREFFPKFEDLPYSKPRMNGTVRVKVQRIKSNEIMETNSHKSKQQIESKKKLMSIRLIIKRMWSSSHTKPLLVLGVVFSLLAGAANPFFSYTFSFLLNGIVPHGNDVGSEGYLLKWSFIVIGVAAADASFGFFKDCLLGYCSENWITNLRSEAMTAITFKKLDWFLQSTNKESEISALVLNDLRDLRTLVTDYLGAVTSFLMISTLGLVRALVSGWKLSLVCISMFPLIIVFSAIYGISLQKCETQYKSAVADLENLLYEISTGVKTIRCLQVEGHFLAKYKTLENRMRRIAGRRLMATGLGVAIIEAMTTCIQSILFYFALKLVIDGEYTSQHMFETFTLLLFTIMSCSALINQIPDITRGQRAATWLYRILDENFNDEKFDKMSSRHAPINNEGTGSSTLISIRDLTFSYPAAKSVDVFRCLNLELFRGSTVAIVGESGSGKSTLMYLLTQLYEPAPHSIFIDGTDINDWGLHDLRNQIAVVEQRAVLFPGTVRENLTYGIVRDVLEIEIYDVLKYAGISDFVISLPNELETEINSELLSGGQAQRLCIARALLRKPRILILDECTSALDPVSAHIINELVRTGPPTMLTISITHCEEMMRACNEIVILKNGRVTEHGFFDELLTKRGDFYNLISTFNEELN